MESNIAGLYDLDKVLGKGHYGIVRLAKHVFSGQKVAVKVIDKTKLDQRETEHLLKEVQCMKLVRHPNVVRLYHVITTKNKLYLVLELGSGGDLLDYLNKMPHGLGEDRTRNYFCQIIRAIAYCHHLHIVHRDLKPENIIFNEDYSVLKLTDFGFSNEFLPGQKLMTYCGSWKYSAPEILLQEEYDPPAVDVWSLGVMLFQMVAGRLPFSEVNESESLTKIMDGKYEMPEEISDTLKDLLSRMIVVEPKDRITVDEILNHPWCLPVKSGGPINGLVHEVGITAEEHEKVARIMADNKIATRDDLERCIAANSYDYVSATYLLLAEQLKQKRIKDKSPITPAPRRPPEHRRGSVPEMHTDLLTDIRNNRSRWQRDVPEQSPRSQQKHLFKKPYSGTGSSCSSEEDPNKSPTLGGEKYCRDDDTFVKGKLKASPKRITTRRPLAALNIHAISSSSDDSEEELEDVGGLLELPRSKTLTRLFRRITPPSGSLVNIEEGSDEGSDENGEISELGMSKSQPSTLRKKKTTMLDAAHSSTYAEEAVDIISPLSTPLSVQRRRDGSSNHSSFSSSVELSSDDSDMDLGKRKKMIISKRDRRSVLRGSNKQTNSNMLSLVQEKLRQLEFGNINEGKEEGEHMKRSEKRSANSASPVTPSNVLPNIAEYTNQQNIKYIRHPIAWNVEDIEHFNNDNSESNGDIGEHFLSRASASNDPMSEEQLPIEMFGGVKSTVCSVM